MRAVKITKRKKARNSNRKVAIHAAASCIFLLPLQEEEGILRLELCSMQVQALASSQLVFRKKGNYNIAVVGHIIIANTIGEGHNGNGQQNVL